MRTIKLTLILAGVVFLAILNVRDTQAQEPIILSPISSMPEMKIGDVYTFTASVDTTNGSASGWYNLTVGPYSYNNVEFDPFTGLASVIITIDAGILNACISGVGTIELTQQAIVYSPVFGTPYSTYRIPCSVLISPQIAAPIMSPVESCNNNTLSSPIQPAGVNPTYADTHWQNGWRTVTFSPFPGYTFSAGIVTSFDYHDADPCLVYPVPPQRFPICGTNNDEVVIPSQPDGIVVVGDETWTDSGSWTIGFETIEGYEIPAGVLVEYLLIDSGPCVTDYPIPPQHTEVCGLNNDMYATFQQPDNVIQSREWDESEGMLTVEFSAAPGYVLPEDTIVSYAFYELGLCETDMPIAPGLVVHCGDNNDEITFPIQPDNVLVGGDTGWDNNIWTVAFSAAEHYMLPANAQTSHQFEDAGPCITEIPLLPVVDFVCGPNNDVVTIPNQPENVTVVSDASWSDGVWTVSYSPAVNYTLPADFERTITLVDEDSPCPTDAPVPPVQTTVCGPDNDLLTFQDQPEGVDLESDSEWSDGIRTVSFEIAPGFATDGETEFIFTDENTPCPTDSPVPPVQTMVCGPDNDILTFQDQPEGISLDADTEWTNNKREITYVVAPEYVTQGATEFAFTDLNEPCEAEPEDAHLRINLVTADGGSLTSTPFRLLSVTAAQVGSGVVLEGVVGAGNLIEVDSILPGEYRLVMSPTGYEPIDFEFTVVEGEAVTEIEVRVTALQAPATQTPDPTAIPTLAPATETATATMPATEAPSATVTPSTGETAVIQTPTGEPQEADPTATVPVSTLPDTGAGSNSGSIIPMTAIALVLALVMGVLIPGRKRS